MKQFLFRGGGQCLFALLLAMHSVGLLYAQSPSDAAFLTSIGALCNASFDEKGKIVEQIAHSGYPSTQSVLAAFLDDRVYCRNQDQKIFLIKPGPEDAPTVALIDPLTLKTLGTASADDVTKVVTNNHLRRVLQTTLARFGLSSSKTSVRLQAVKDMERDLNEGNVQLLRERSALETNWRVKKEIAVGLALADLDGSDAQARLAAIATLKGSMRQDVLNKLQALVEKSPDGTFAESDEHVRKAAGAAIQSMESWRSFYSGVQTVLFGLSLGSILVLIAIGLGITFGVMGVINMAHGELMMLGAYATYVVQMAMPGYIGSSVLVAVPVAFLVSGLTGILIERTIIRFLYGRPLETLLATFGVSLILQQFVRTIFTALNREVKTPEWMSGTLQLNEALSITYNRLYILIFTLLVFAALLMVLKKTRIGLEIRAVAQNRAMARAMGIRSEWVDAITFGLGSGIAGIAGVALSQVTNVNANLGQSYIIDAFMVIVFGGVGSLWGAMVAGLLMGVVDQLLQPYAGAVLAKILVLIALILFIQARPRGLFPATGRAAESQ
ncbi:MAG TPA: urea ABC transporter permease subunit UrtB [Candidatus Acidoferrales bacterium]|nr:urea ABC transporter permease subunit UrtB [Candidatus Acidoferrales bacterium]